MQIIQYVGIILALFLLVKTIQKWREGKLRKGEMFFWVLVWLAVIIVAVLPQTTNFLAKVVGIGRGIDVVVYLSVLVLFYLVFKIYVKLDKVERTITSLVGEMAIEREEVKKKND